MRQVVVSWESEEETTHRSIDKTENKKRYFREISRYKGAVFTTDVIGASDICLNLRYWSYISREIYFCTEYMTRQTTQIEELNFTEKIIMCMCVFMCYFWQRITVKLHNFVVKSALHTTKKSKHCLKTISLVSLLDSNRLFWKRLYATCLDVTDM